MKFTHLIEGVVERDPMSDQFVIRVDSGSGVLSIFNPQKALAALEGKEVRFTLISFDELDALTKLVEDTQNSGN